jgi:hypothetical protein
MGLYNNIKKYIINVKKGYRLDSKAIFMPTGDFSFPAQFWATSFEAYLGLIQNFIFIKK